MRASPASPGTEHPFDLHVLTAGLRPYGLLALLCLALFLPGIAAIPVFDRDEARFAQASHQMLESGDYIRIRNQAEIRAKKPAGIYWLQAAAARLTGAETSIWAYRIPSVLGAIAAVLLTFYLGRTLVRRPAALIGAALLASCLLLVNEAHMAKTDAVLLACVVMAQGALGRLYVKSRRKGHSLPAPIAPLPLPTPLTSGLFAEEGVLEAADPELRPNLLTPVREGYRADLPSVLIFWFAQALGILVKGPLVAIISLLTIGTLWIVDRNVRWLTGIRPLAGLGIIAVLVGPWVWAISHATQGQFIGQAIKNDLLPKLLGSQESHGAPPTYYLVLLILTFWPGSLFVIPALWRGAKRRHEPATRFLLAWIVPAWIMFEAIPTKLPHYVLPLYPPLALLAGMWLAKKTTERRAWVHQYALVWGLIGMGLGIAVMITPVRLASSYPWWFGEIGVLALASGLLPAQALRTGRPRLALGLSLVGAVLVFGSIYQCVLPHLDRMWISQSIAKSIPAGAPVAAAGYHEPSLVFTLGTNTLLTDGVGAAQFLDQTPNGYAVVDDKTKHDFDAALAKSGRTVQLVATIDGFDYTHGKSTQITVWRTNK